MTCPAWSTLTLMVMGTPASGPASSPRARRSSMRCAALRASAGISVTTALMAGLTCASRASALSVASRAETWRDRMSAASSLADIRQSSAITGSPPLQCRLSSIHRRARSPTQRPAPKLRAGGASGPAAGHCVAQLVITPRGPAPLTLPTSSALVRRMKSAAATPGPARAVSLPNVLTYLRILAVPAVVLCLFLIKGDAGRWWALGVYVGACITDWLDGYLARVWDQQSMLGRMLDPIADKLLVGTTLLMLTYDNTIDGPARGRRRHHPVPRDPGLRPARVPGRAQCQGARHAARQVEDDHADDRARHPAGGSGRRQARAGASPGPASRCCGWRRC